MHNLHLKYIIFVKIQIKKRKKNHYYAKNRLALY